jgi:hypothetical protein
LAACGLSEDQYQEKYLDKYCDQYDTCDPEAQCDVDSFPDMYNNCDYEPKTARQCLQAEWTCNTDFDPIIFPEPADICEDVYVCGKDKDDTATNR